MQDEKYTCSAGKNVPLAVTNITANLSTLKALREK